MELEKLQKFFFKKNLNDWGTFYTKEIFPHIEKDDEDEFELWRGFYVSSEGRISPAKLHVYTKLDGKDIPEHLFLFSVISKKEAVLASNL